MSGEIDKNMVDTAGSGVADTSWPNVIENGFNESAIWLVPLLLVLLQFLLKLFVGERASWHQIWKGFLQSPVDVGFLAISFAGTLIISKPASVGGVFATAIVFVVISMLSIIIWKESPTHITRDSMIKSSILVILNYLFTGAMLVYSVYLIMDGV
ncbi:hypothetical protein KUV56_15655 [Ferrimonas balearica]|uniref:hypothetical protein n=1 Tax=Ferrimonas balearica TaxID=44012 RepID=UPI001C598EF2|nr:hypothetical protein [Ferrimonas balearica]MBW3140930.1 hypothetical protein [Ferrimonas balearica]